MYCYIYPVLLLNNTNRQIDYLPFKTIEELRDIAYSIVGEPEKVQFGDRVVGIIEARDGTIMDVVRQIKPYEFA